MRLLLILTAVLLAAIARAQNVGIGKSNPTEKLDVAGNVNIDGRLKLNGSSGQPGQMLMVQPDGSQQWINSFGYKRRIQLFNGIGWTVPPNVNEVLIEVLGGGGGGAKGGGGGGGGYAIVSVKIAPGTIITPFIPPIPTGVPPSTEGGSGGQGATTTVSGSGFFIQSYGGTGAKSSSPGIGSAAAVSGDSVLGYQIFCGGFGSPMVETYSQRSATEFVTMRKQGDGGFCAIAPDLVAKGGFFSFNTQTFGNITVVYSPSQTNCYGCGGAGGNTEPPQASWGGYGGIGAVFVSY